METYIFRIILLVVFAVILCLVQKGKISSPARVIGGLVVLSLLIVGMNYLVNVLNHICALGMNYISHYVSLSYEQINIAYFVVEALAAVVLELIAILGCCYLYKGISGEAAGGFKILRSQSTQWKVALLVIVIAEALFCFFYQWVLFDKMLSGGLTVQFAYYQFYDRIRMVISLVIVAIETVACIGKLKSNNDEDPCGQE